MQVVCWNLTVLLIAALYYVWRDRFARRASHEKLLRERVAYMLWVTAQLPT